MKINEHYDNSQISTYQQCPFSYYLQYIKGIRKIFIDDSNASMNFGSYVHKFLEAHFKDSKCSFNDIIKDYEEPEDLPQYSTDSLKLFCRTYLEKYQVKDKEFEVKEVEKNSICDLGKYKFIVKKDGVIKYNDNIFGLENKTTKSISYNYFDKYFINSQIDAQCFTTYQDYNQCSGILLNVGEIKFLKRKPTGNYDSFKQVEDGWIAIKFNRDFVNRNKSELDQWKANTLMWIDRIEESKKNNNWARSTGLWGGMICSKCQYKELCKVSVGMELDESILNVLYEVVDPYEYLKGEKNGI